MTATHYSLPPVSAPTTSSGWTRRVVCCVSTSRRRDCRQRAKSHRDRFQSRLRRPSRSTPRRRSALGSLLNRPETPVVAPPYIPADPFIGFPTMRSLRLVALLAIPAQLRLPSKPSSTGTRNHAQPRTGDFDRPAEQPAVPADARTCCGREREHSHRVRRAAAAVDRQPRQLVHTGRHPVRPGRRAAVEPRDRTARGIRSGLNYSINAAAAYLPRAAKANQAAAEADITNGAEVLRSNVTQDYITALQNQAQAAVLDTLVQTAQGQLELVNAKLEVGAGTIIDVRAAEVALGQAQVNALDRAQHGAHCQTAAVPGYGRRRRTPTRTSRRRSRSRSRRSRSTRCCRWPGA